MPSLCQSEIELEFITLNDVPAFTLIVPPVYFLYVIEGVIVLFLTSDFVCEFGYFVMLGNAGKFGSMISWLGGICIFFSNAVEFIFISLTNWFGL